MGEDSGSLCFDVGTDSPVKVDSSTLKELAETRRPSAGTLSPASRMTKSPGTRAWAGIFCHSPSRTTLQWGAVSFFRASKERSARYSWTKPSTALRRTIARMARASTTSPSRAETPVETRSTKTMKSLNWFTNSASGDTFFPSTRRLGPSLLRRWAASPWLSPRSR